MRLLARSHRDPLIGVQIIVWQQKKLVKRAAVFGLAGKSGMITPRQRRCIPMRLARVNDRYWPG
jgi:hypothetical protein